MSNGFIKLPRDLLKNKIWKSFSYEYRHIFLTILENAAFYPVTLNDHGVLTDLEPGQFLTTERDLVKLCDEKDIDKSKVHRALELFKKVGFSDHKTNHKKTLITITLPMICELINESCEPRTEPNSNQTRTIKQERTRKNKNNVRGVLLSEDKTIILGLEEKPMQEFDSACKTAGFVTSDVLAYCLKVANEKYQANDLGSAIPFIFGIVKKFDPKKDGKPKQQPIGNSTAFELDEDLAAARERQQLAKTR
jgi:hypothetical protein